MYIMYLTVELCEKTFLCVDNSILKIKRCVDDDDLMKEVFFHFAIFYCE